MKHMWGIMNKILNSKFIIKLKMIRMYSVLFKKMMIIYCKDIDIIIMTMIHPVINFMMIVITQVECLNFARITHS